MPIKFAKVGREGKWEKDGGDGRAKCVKIYTDKYGGSFIKGENKQNN